MQKSSMGMLPALNEFAAGDPPELGRLTSERASIVFGGVYENLITSDSARISTVVLVCSASKKEGATTIASGLAIAASQRRGGETLLMDCNYHNPNVLKVFGKGRGSTGERERLLSDLVEKHGYAGTEVSSTPLAGLTIMGTAHGLKNHVQALEPPRFRNMLDELTQIFTFVVIDGPPVNLHSESTLLGSQVDRILLVVHAGVTRMPVASKAVERLSAGGIQPQVILNRRDFPIPDAVYRRL